MHMNVPVYGGVDESHSCNSYWPGLCFIFDISRLDPYPHSLTKSICVFCFYVVVTPRVFTMTLYVHTHMAVCGLSRWVISRMLYALYVICLPYYKRQAQLES